MNKLSSLSLVAILAAAVAAGPVLAATPKFVNGAPGTAIGVDQFVSEAGVFNAKEIDELLRAKKVVVYHYGNAWTKKTGKAVNFLTDDAQSIGLLRAALNKDPHAVKLLAMNKIKVDQVVGIIKAGNGVQLYIQ